MNFDQARAVINKSIGEYHTVVEPRLRELEAALQIAIDAQNEINAAPAEVKLVREEQSCAGNFARSVNDGNIRKSNRTG